MKKTKKNIFKKGALVLLAFIMCLSSFMSIANITTFAATETDEVVAFAFPRNGDENYEGEWGNDSLKLMNGWKQDDARSTNVYAMGSWTGNICYCLEPGTVVSGGDMLTKQDENYWDNYPSAYNHTISPDEIKLFIGRILQYGYTGTVTTAWRSQNEEDANKIAQARATQLLIWETVVGERDADFKHVDTGSYDAVLDCVSKKHPLYDKIMSYYNNIVSSVQKHAKLPSFFAKTTGKASTVQLTWNGTKYTTTLSDTNNVLGNYNFSANQSGISFSVSGNKLTVTADKEPSGSVLITAEKKNSQRTGIVIWGDGVYAPGKGLQDLATYAENVKDPVKGFLNIKVSYGTAKIVKTSEDGKVGGISFTITGNGVNQKVTTDSKGQVEIENLTPGEYTVTEEQYDLYEPQESHKITVVSGQATTVTFNNTLKRGSIRVIKSAEDNFVEGVRFHLYGTALSGAKIDTYAVTDKNGVAVFEDIPITGTTPYTIEEVDTENRYEVPKAQKVLVEWKKVTECKVHNTLKKWNVKVVKVDAESGKAIPYAGAGFQIYDPSGKLITMQDADGKDINTFYTDKTGSFTTLEKLVYGKGYSLVEVKAPNGYVLDGTSVKFDVLTENVTQEGGVTVIKVSKADKAQKGTITVEKTGEIFYGVLVSGGVDEAGNEAPVMYQPTYELAGLEGATYEIRAAEDIYTPDGTLRYAKGKVVDTITTGKSGLAKSKQLYLGKYEVKETKAPYGMVINEEVRTVELTYAGQNVSVTETTASFCNERQKVQISLHKVLEANEIFGIGNNDELKNIRFGLFAAEELVSASGTTIPADGLIEVMVLDDSGNAMAKTDLPMGSYYVQELTTNSAYQLNGEKYPVVFAYEGQECAVVELTANNGESIPNDLIYGSVSGLKVDENGQSLAGALIGLFLPGSTEFTTETALMTTVSDEKGRFEFSDVPYGTWRVREIEQPTGYLLNDTLFEVIIQENAQVVEIEIVNEKIHGGIILTKVDEEYPDNKLTGAIFEVYADTNDNAELDEEDVLVGNLTETEAGIYTMTELQYGRYFVKETMAPEGFYLDENVYSIFIDAEDGAYYIENKAGVGFINQPMKGSLKIVKTSSDGKLEGFAFRITGVNGYDETFETDANGEIIVEGLRVGEYVVSEVVNEASVGYIRPGDKQAVIVADATTIVEMYNFYEEQPEVPKTGDDDSVVVWGALACVAVVGILVVMVGFRKKKK